MSDSNLKKILSEIFLNTLNFFNVANTIKCTTYRAPVRMYWRQKHSVDWYFLGTVTLSSKLHVLVQSNVTQYYTVKYKISTVIIRQVHVHVTIVTENLS